MAITLTSRKTRRQQLASLLDTNVTDLVAVYDHQVKNFGGRSPVATVHSDGTRTVFPDYTREYHRFLITLWWKRSDDEDTEDYIDDLAQAVRQTLINHAEEPGYWSDIFFEDEQTGIDYSQMDYVILDGVMYRRELIRVVTLVISA